MAAARAIDMRNDLAPGFSSDEEEDTRHWPGPALTTARKRVGNRKRNHAHISQRDVTGVIAHRKQSLLSSKKVRARSSSPLPSERRISPRGHASSLAVGAASKSSSSKGPLRRRSHKVSRNHHLLALPSQEAPTWSRHSLSPPQHERLPPNTLLRPTDDLAQLPHDESMGESTATTTSTSNNNQRYMASKDTGTTITTEITSNVHLKRKADVGGYENQSMLFQDDDYVGDDDDDDDDDEEEEQDNLGSDERLHRPAGLSSRAGPPTRRKVRKHSRERSTNMRSFTVDVDNRFFGLIEGMQPVTVREEHRYAILHPQEQCSNAMPHAGRMLELPAEALKGLWTAKLTSSGAGSTVSMNSDEVESLETCTLSLRHSSREGLPRLSNFYGGHARTAVDLPPPSSNTSNLLATATGPMDPDNVMVSIIHPQWTRQTQMDLQRVSNNIEQHYQCQDSTASSTAAAPAKAKPDNEQDYFIGSINLASFMGFTCSGDLNMNAGKECSAILEGVEEERGQHVPSLQAIFGATRAIGVSVLCNLDIGADYILWIAQDLTLPKSQIVALDITFSDAKTLLGKRADRQGLLLSASPTSSMSARDGMDEDDDGPLRELSEMNLRAHTQSIGRTVYDPMQRFWTDLKKAAAATTKTHRPLCVENCGPPQQQHHTTSNGVRSDAMLKEPPTVEVPVIPVDLEAHPSLTPGPTKPRARKDHFATTRDNPALRHSTARKGGAVAATSKSKMVPAGSAIRKQKESVPLSQDASKPPAETIGNFPSPDRFSLSSRSPLDTFAVAACRQSSSDVHVKPKKRDVDHVSEKKVVNESKLVTVESSGNDERGVRGAAKQSLSQGGALLQPKQNGVVCGIPHSRATSVTRLGSSTSSGNKSADQPERPKKSVADFFQEQLPSRSLVKTKQQQQVQSQAAPGALIAWGFKEPDLAEEGLELAPTKVASSWTSCQHFRRPISSRSTLRMLIFAAWCLLTWSTATVDPIVENKLSAFNIPSPEESLPLLVVRRPKSPRGYFSSRFFPGREKDVP